MFRAESIKLVSGVPGNRGVFEPVTETLREVAAESRSVGMQETYTAMSQGLRPSVSFKLALAEDYQNEKELEWNGERYRILRTYRAGDGIELTCERRDDDV